MFEKNVAATLGDAVEYEPDRIPFTQPAKKRSYTPDFKLREGVYIECKGLLSAEDRAKMVWVRDQHPELTFYLYFQASKVKIRKGSKVTYGDWATKNGFDWGDHSEGIPKRWLKDAND
jgi:hypothetical protein